MKKHKKNSLLSNSLNRANNNEKSIEILNKKSLNKKKNKKQNSNRYLVSLDSLNFENNDYYDNYLKKIQSEKKSSTNNKLKHISLSNFVKPNFFFNSKFPEKNKSKTKFIRLKSNNSDNKNFNLLLKKSLITQQNRLKYSNILQTNTIQSISNFNKNNESFSILKTDFQNEEKNKSSIPKKKKSLFINNSNSQLINLMGLHQLNINNINNNNKIIKENNINNSNEKNQNKEINNNNNNNKFNDFPDLDFVKIKKTNTGKNNIKNETTNNNTINNNVIIYNNNNNVNINKNNENKHSFEKKENELFSKNKNIIKRRRCSIQIKNKNNSHSLLNTSEKQIAKIFKRNNSYKINDNKNINILLNNHKKVNVNTTKTNKNLFSNIKKIEIKNHKNKVKEKEKEKEKENEKIKTKKIENLINNISINKTASNNSNENKKKKNNFCCCLPFKSNKIEINT